MKIRNVYLFFLNFLMKYSQVVFLCKHEGTWAKSGNGTEKVIVDDRCCILSLFPTHRRRWRWREEELLVWFWRLQLCTSYMHWLKRERWNHRGSNEFRYWKISQNLCHWNKTFLAGQKDKEKKKKIIHIPGQNKVGALSRWNRSCGVLLSPLQLTEHCWS